MSSTRSKPVIFGASGFSAPSFGPVNFFEPQVVRREEENLRVGASRSVVFGLDGGSDQQRHSGLGQTGEIVEIVVLAKTVDCIAGFERGEQNHDSASLLGQGFSADVIIRIGLAIEGGCQTAGENKDKRRKHQLAHQSSIIMNLYRKVLFRSFYPDDGVLHFADARFFPASMKDCTLLLSIRPEPVSTKLGMGAKLSFDQSVSSDDGL